MGTNAHDLPQKLTTRPMLRKFRPMTSWAKINFNIILKYSKHAHVGFTTKFVMLFLSPQACYLFHHFILPDSVILTIQAEEYTLWNSSLSPLHCYILSLRSKYSSQHFSLNTANLNRTSIHELQLLTLWFSSAMENKGSINFKSKSSFCTHVCLTC